VYSTLFGIGKLIFGEIVPAVILLTIALASFLWIARSFRSETALPPAPASP
jgi:ABC-type transport system involved in cytochrome c biogenesis permease component